MTPRGCFQSSIHPQIVPLKKIKSEVFPLFWFVRSMGAEPLMPANQRATSQSWQQEWLHRHRLRTRLRYDWPLKREPRKSAFWWISTSASLFLTVVLIFETVLFQSFKRKPGQADNERSTGDDNERVNKRLRTVESSKDRTEDSRQSDAQQESDLYEHIKQGEEAYDTQTYGQ